MITEKEIVERTGLVRCEFDDECDFCNRPKNGSYVELCHIPEDVTESNYYICGKCVEKVLRCIKNDSKNPEGYFIPSNYLKEIY